MYYSVVDGSENVLWYEVHVAVSVSSDGSLLTGDLETTYGFTRKVWSPHVIENGVPAHLDHTGHNSRLYLVLEDQEGIEETNTTVTPDSGKRHVSNHFYRWIVTVGWYVNTVIGIIHHPAFFV
jgi:hypothetical protein